MVVDLRFLFCLVKFFFFFLILAIYMASTSPNHQNHEEGSHHQHHERNAAERNYSDINFRAYLASTFFLVALRCSLLHPLYMIVARKQICSVTGKKGFLQIAREMHRTEGGMYKAFTQGLVMMTTGMAVSETTFNGVYEFSRYYLEDSWKLSLSSATAGGAWMGDWSSRILFSPFNVVAIRQMTYNCPNVTHHALEFKNNSAIHMIKESYRVAGFRSFFSGMGLVLCVGSFNSSVFFTAYVNSKKIAYSTFGPWLEQFENDMADHNNFQRDHRFLSHFPSSWTSSSDNFVLNSGASLVGSSLASVIVNPYYVLLGKVQSGVAKNVREAISLVMKGPGGAKVLFRGAAANAAATMFDCWLASSTYELAMKVGMEVTLEE